MLSEGKQPTRSNREGETPMASIFALRNSSSISLALHRSQYSYQEGIKSRRNDRARWAEQSENLGYVLGGLVSQPTIAGAGHVTYRVPGLKVIRCVYTTTPVSPVSSCYSCIHVLHLCTLGYKHTHRIRVQPVSNKDCTFTYLSIFVHICQVDTLAEGHMLAILTWIYDILTV